MLHLHSISFETVKNCDDQFAGRWWGRFENCWEIWQGQSHCVFYFTKPRSIVCVCVFCIISCHYVSFHFPTTLQFYESYVHYEEEEDYDSSDHFENEFWYELIHKLWIIQHYHIPCSWLLWSHLYFHWNRKGDTLLDYWGSRFRGEGFGFLVVYRFRDLFGRFM